MQTAEDDYERIRSPAVRYRLLVKIVLTIVKPAGKPFVGGLFLGGLKRTFRKIKTVHLMRQARNQRLPVGGAGAASDTGNMGQRSLSFEYVFAQPGERASFYAAGYLQVYICAE